MQLRRWAFYSVAFFILAGCETQPEDIAKWKAEKNTGKLVKTLEDGRQFMRLDAINALAEIKAEQAVDALGALISDPDVVIVHAAIDALAEIGTPSIEPYMNEALTYKTDPARLTAAKSLGTLKAKQSVDALITALDDKYETVAVAAAVSLGQIGESRAIPALAQTSLHGSVRLRGASITSICQIGGEASMEPLIAVMGDVSPVVRNEATAGLIKIGAPVEPAALKALESENNYERQSALAILDGIKKVPTAGSDLVWYTLADLAVGENPEIQLAEAQKLAEIRNGAPALIAALSHPNYGIREHAFAAVEVAGEPLAEQVLAATSGIKPEAARWLRERSKWAGAPAWSIDLWAGATALNPSFHLDERESRLLSQEGKATEDLLRSNKFKPEREVIPLLISQMAASQSEDAKLIKTAEKRKTLAFRKLRAYRQKAKLPLMAAVNDQDLQIAALAARVLVEIDDDPRVPAAIIESFTTRVETGEELHDTPLYDAVVELGYPETEDLILRIRPNPTGALYAFSKKYPDIQVSNMSLPEGKVHPTAEPFRLKYVLNGRAHDLKVVFRLNEEGNWLPNPPFPDELPDR